MDANGGDERFPLLAGRYRLLGRLGSGGMGVVWHAFDKVLGREVAVKEVRAPEHLREADVRVLHARLVQEARAAARISHPCVITVHDVVEEHGRPWIVMELVRGRSLADVLEHDGLLPPPEAARVGSAVLRALRSAHSAGVLHRDVKPANVLLEDGGRVVLTDFGIALVEGAGTLTRTGDVIGSPDYLAPERALGKHPGTPSDLWSLGATLYAAVEGMSPFRRASALGTLQAVVHEDPPPPRRAGALAPLLLGLLRKDPQTRMGSVEAQRLLDAAAAEGPGERTGGTAGTAGSPVHGGPDRTGAGRTGRTGDGWTRTDPTTATQPWTGAGTPGGAGTPAGFGTPGGAGTRGGSGTPGGAGTQGGSGTPGGAGTQGGSRTPGGAGTQGSSRTPGGSGTPGGPGTPGRSATPGSAGTPSGSGTPAGPGTSDTPSPTTATPHRPAYHPTYIPTSPDVRPPTPSGAPAPGTGGTPPTVRSSPSPSTPPTPVAHLYAAGAPDPAPAGSPVPAGRGRWSARRLILPLAALLIAGGGVSAVLFLDDAKDPGTGSSGGTSTRSAAPGPVKQPEPASGTEGGAPPATPSASDAPTAATPPDRPPETPGATTTCPPGSWVATCRPY
ncbi:serine/threonine-protein kinase [Streptomyces sp. I05A-00742]|uniref:serine/threonine-protein kinase n=1 Tax=Streptomyces sp. I05A-00742 TaxID=2732853 RepID=UPI0020177E56|nr:serine/threonine-protein kinase [Streptomyces sp. I05A-00742]